MRRALVLHGDRDRIVRTHGEVADAQSVQGGVERQFPPKRAASPVHETERRRHGRQVEFYARKVRVRGDAAVGDDEGLAVGEQRDLVRADAVGRKLAHARVSSRRVVDADDAALALEIVLGGVEQPPVPAEYAVAVEVAVGRRLYPACGGAPREVQQQREAAGAPGKMQSGASPGADGEGMPPPRQGQIEERGAVRREAADPVTAGGVGAGAEVERRPRRSGVSEERRRQQQAGKPAGEQPQRGVGDQSPSRALKPTARPSAERQAVSHDLSQRPHLLGELLDQRPERGIGRGTLDGAVDGLRRDTRVRRNALRIRRSSLGSAAAVSSPSPAPASPR